MGAIFDDFSADFVAGREKLLESTGVAKGVLQNHNFERTGILYEDFVGVNAEVFIDIQIYGDCLTNFDGFYNSEAGKRTDANFIAGVYIEGFQ